MRAVVIEQFGGPEQLKLRERPEPTPLPAHVVIEVKAFGLNHAEVYFRKGVWGDVARVSGIECVGVVRADPDGRFAAGRTVAALMGGMGRTCDGSYAQFTRVPSANVVAVETTLPWDELAAIPESYATAWTCVARNLALAAGHTALIRGATSALGQAAVNIAVGMGAQVIATTRNTDRFATLRALGAQTPMRDSATLSQEVRKRHPNGIDAVLDLVGTSTLLDSLAMVRPDGRVCMAGFLGGAEPLAGFDPMLHMPSGVHVSFFASAFTFGNADYPLSNIPLQQMIDRVADGTYKAKPVRVFRLDEIEDAHRLMESNAANGKIVVRL